MALSVLITQCLQRDFIAPIAPHDPLPNRLHVGHLEALRLLGPDPSAGPVAQLMAWARSQPSDAIEIIHIRDWHDCQDPKQRDHLATFGDHCVRGTKGAELILDLDRAIALRPNETIVDSIALNDFEGTTLGARLAELKRRAGGEPLRVGVIGVWTEAKVSFLLYDLKTRCQIDLLGTCSALTASASRAQHFNALEQLGRILGVRCFDSVGEFVSWLSPGAALSLPEAPRRFGAKLEIAGGHPSLSDADRHIVCWLYRDSSRIVLEPLSGGFSGAHVFKASSKDALGHQQAPSVVKLGPTGTIGKERTAFERVEEVLGNNAPSVRGFVDLEERAGIKYSYAAMGQGQVRTLKSLFELGAPDEKIDLILRSVFEEILGPLYAAAQYERCPLLGHYGFSPKWAEAVRRRVGEIAGARGASERIRFSADYEAQNICHFYEEFLGAPSAPESGEFHYVSYVHGDLNGANILIDARDNVWVIDFFHTGRGHVLKDLAKLENDLLYIFTPIRSREVFEEALLITRALRGVADLGRPLPEAIDGLRTPELLRAYRSIRTLRELGAGICRDDRHPLQAAIALLRYAVHTLSFDESSALQKEWALAAACGFGEDIERTSKADRALRVDWLEAPRLSTGKLGLTLCPGRRDRGRDLAADLDALRAAGVSRLLCLLTEGELEWAGVSALGREAEARGLVFRHHPVRDQSAPGIDDAVCLARWCLEAIDRGEKVVVHCMGGLGRAGTIAAAVLMARGMTASDAIRAVRKARGPRAVETREQEEFVAALGGEPLFATAPALGGGVCEGGGEADLPASARALGDGASLGGGEAELVASAPPAAEGASEAGGPGKAGPGGSPA